MNKKNKLIASRTSKAYPTQSSRKKTTRDLATETKLKTLKIINGGVSLNI